MGSPVYRAVRGLVEALAEAASRRRLVGWFVLQQGLEGHQLQLEVGEDLLVHFVRPKLQLQHLVRCEYQPFQLLSFCVCHTWKGNSVLPLHHVHEWTAGLEPAP